MGGSCQTYSEATHHAHICRQEGPDENPLRYYEIDFLEAVNSDGTLVEEKLANAVMSVRDTLEAKLRVTAEKRLRSITEKLLTKLGHR